MSQHGPCPRGEAGRSWPTTCPGGIITLVARLEQLQIGGGVTGCALYSTSFRRIKLSRSKYGIGDSSDPTTRGDVTAISFYKPGTIDVLSLFLLHHEVLFDVRELLMCAANALATIFSPSLRAPLFLPSNRDDMRKEIIAFELPLTRNPLTERIRMVSGPPQLLSSF